MKNKKAGCACNGYADANSSTPHHANEIQCDSLHGKKILIIGATGAMAVYLIPELLNKGCSVVGVSLDKAESDNENLTYIQGDAKDKDFLSSLLSVKYDAIVDFMVYNSVSLYSEYYKLFLENTSHYVFLSTYRVYADDSPLDENSKRLLDVDKPDDFVCEYEYSVYKAEEEDFLKNSPYTNYTIVRPAITYSKRRLQLTTLEADVLVYRMLNGKTVVLPESTLNVYATMSWAGDVAKMFSAIILNPKAYGEVYNVSTAEHMLWKDVAKIYEDIGGLKYVTVDDETYIQIVAGDSDFVTYARQQLLYDRCVNRIVDNRKILDLCNLRQDELMPLKDGIKRELTRIKLSDIGCDKRINERMDDYLKKMGIE